MKPTILGIVNITEDSFSDGGKYARAENAIAHALRLREEGADVIDLGAAASNPAARAVSAGEEMARLRPVIEALQAEDASVSVDSFASETQRFALAAGADYLNDINGFADADFYPELARGAARLIVMHSVQGRGPATREAAELDGASIVARGVAFFEERLAALRRAGVREERLILDPGMGFFLGPESEASLEVLRELGRLRERFSLPVLVSTSRKSFLRVVSGAPLERVGAATLASELFSVVVGGADYVRTHEPRPLREALAVWRALAS